MKNEYQFKMSKYLLHNLLKQNLITQSEYYNTLKDLAKEYKIKYDTDTEEE